jgi:hypothetical protein
MSGTAAEGRHAINAIVKAPAITREHLGSYVDAVAALAGTALTPGGRQVPLVFTAWDSATRRDPATAVVDGSGNPARTSGPPAR